MEYINLYHVSEQCIALGPGVRYVIWVQGCLQNCNGCITPQSRPLKINKLVNIDDLTNSIVNNKLINGITISGGEPFLQAKNLTNLLKNIRHLRPELNVLVFSGYNIEQLHTEHAKKFIEYIDVLIDGPYKKELSISRGLRGSSNQRFHFLTERLSKYKEEMENGERRMEVIMNTKGIHIIGIPRTDISLKNLILQNL